MDTGRGPQVLGGPCKITRGGPLKIVTGLLPLIKARKLQEGSLAARGNGLLAVRGPLLLIEGPRALDRVNAAKTHHCC